VHLIRLIPVTEPKQHNGSYEQYKTGRWHGKSYLLLKKRQYLFIERNYQLEVLEGDLYKPHWFQHTAIFKKTVLTNISLCDMEMISIT